MTKETMDLISMDVIMPGLDGFQATRKTVRDEVTPQIPVILSTANSQTTDKIWALGQGALKLLNINW